MAVTFDSSASNNATINGSATSGSVSCTHRVNPLVSNVVAVVGILFTGQTDTAGSTWTAQFGGVSMTPQAAVEWDSGESVPLANLVKMFTLMNPASGESTVTASFASLGTEALERNFIIISATYWGVASVGSPQHTGYPPANTTSNSITVSSVSPAHRVVGLHGCSDVLNGYIGNNSVRRGNVGEIGGLLLLQDAPGAATVTETVTMLFNSLFWGAIGIDLVPAIVPASAAVTIPGVPTSSRATLHRVETPNPDRYWVVDGGGLY